MKIAISGKEGRQDYISCSAFQSFAELGYSVIAIDVDPDANLAATLRFPPG